MGWMMATGDGRRAFPLHDATARPDPRSGAWRPDLAHPGIDLDTRIAGIVDIFERENLPHIILVGWSYRGTVVTGVIGTKVTPEQEDFVAPNLYSIAEAYVEPSWTPLAIYAGEELVGFSMFGRDV